MLPKESIPLFQIDVEPYAAIVGIITVPSWTLLTKNRGNNKENESLTLPVTGGDYRLRSSSDYVTGTRGPVSR
ncbi:unnamed protein product [Cylicocyclus nassatus]|uniref:Uncharacterized protein n=1 Tax=Cylicocyclus nassatus TaxID=53992 RepID=A0AA36H7D7_CYLNA|nr:unnamed protein product [Cylicocyclus nassatus]